MKILLFANGHIVMGSALEAALASGKDCRVICADGGALHARAHGLVPHTIIGDFDSLTPAELSEFRALGSRIMRFPAEKNETDLELALLHCRDIGADTVTILGALGGRLDQTMANILLLSLPELRPMPITIVDGEETIRVLQPGKHEIVGASGDTISLIALGGAVHGITTRQLKYPLRGESLLSGPARGLSNVMLAERASLDFGQGTLLLSHTRGRA